MAQTNTNTSSGAGIGFASQVVDAIGVVWTSHINSKANQKVAEYNAKTAEAYAQAAAYSQPQGATLAAGGSNNTAIIVVVAIAVVAIGFVIIKKTL